jgi:hypothetical protein
LHSAISRFSGGLADILKMFVRVEHRPRSGAAAQGHHKRENASDGFHTSFSIVGLPRGRTGLFSLFVSFRGRQYGWCSISFFIKVPQSGLEAEFVITDGRLRCRGGQLRTIGRVSRCNLSKRMHPLVHSLRRLPACAQSWCRR